MTSLDRAFIKAYAEVVPHVGRPAGTRDSAVASPPEVREPAEPREHTEPHMQTEPRKQVAERRAPLSPAKPARVLQARPIARPTAETAPLSSFAAPPAHEEELRAALEVESLEWPKICGELLSRSRRRWDQFCDQLSERVAHGETCIALASCDRGAGRTTVALTAARCLGARGVRTLVVDADFENPKLAESCGMTPHTGWSDVIEGRRPLGEALIAAVGEAVTLMPWLGRGQHVARPSDTLRMGAHFTRLKQHYDLIVLDAMPLAGPSAVTNFARLVAAVPVDAVYLVSDARSTTSEQLADTCAKLSRAGAVVAGIIENFSAYANLSDASPRDKAPTSVGRPSATQG